jgi:hypothetical protein
MESDDEVECVPAPPADNPEAAPDETEEPPWLDTLLACLNESPPLTTDGDPDA